MRAICGVLGISLVLLSLVYKTSAIHCYYCNSANNTACLNLEEVLQDIDEESRHLIVPLVQCDMAIPSPVSKSFFCRKIVQRIFHTERESELRVTRGCGWIRSQRECYRADNSDHQETVCECYHDACNSSDTVNPAVISVLFLAFALVLYFYR